MTANYRVLSGEHGKRSGGFARFFVGAIALAAAIVAAVGRVELPRAQNVLIK
jgi:hypothetical protein